MTFLEGSETEVIDATIFKRQWHDRAQITSDVITKPQAYETIKNSASWLFRSNVSNE